ncbi:MAG: hypothetical protein ABR521_07480 [Gaiellaceae bacterium]
MHAAALERVRAHPGLALAGLVATAAAARAGIATQVETPWFLVDELIHSELAKSLAAGGGFDVRGEHVAVSYVYPALIAPAWWAGSIATTYVLAKAIGALIMSLAAVPVYLWGRRFVSPLAALGAAALTLCLPWFVLTGTLMTENAFFPAFVTSLFAIALVLEEPTRKRQAFAAAAIAVATATRFQGAVLVPILGAAALTCALLERRRDRLLALWPLGAAAAVAAAGYVVARLAGGGSLLGLGVYAGVRRVDYSFGGQLRWSADNLGELVLAVGVVPALALAPLLAGARRAPAAERAFLAVTASALGCLVALAAVASSWEPAGIKERYMFHAMPPLLLALVLWISRGAPRGRAAAVGAAAAIALVAALPLRRLFAEPSLVGNAFGLLPFERLAHAAGGVPSARAAAILGTLATAALFLLLPRRLTPLLAPAVGGFLLLSSIPVFTTIRNQSRALRDLAGYGDEPAWIDEAIGKRGNAVFLNTSNFEPETLAGRFYEQFEPVWAAEFWNRSLRGVVSLGHQEPAPLAQGSTTLDWATGAVVGQRADHVVARPRFPLVGERLAGAGDLELWRVGGPVRLAAATEGVFADGKAGALAAYSRWAPAPGAVEVGAPPAARVAIGPLEPLPGGGARIGAVVRRAVVGAGGAVLLAAPRPPFRIEVDGAAPGPVSFRLVPRRG